METNIRMAVRADYPEILELIREFSIYQKSAEKMTNQMDRMITEEAFFHCFIAETPEKKIIGYTTWFYTYYTWSGKGMYIDDLYVKPEFRRNGIGKRLLGTIIDLARKSGCHKLRWQVSGWNLPAIAFYRKMGAEIDDIEKNCDLNLD